MARPRKIDRDALLDAAETVLTDQGATALSFATVAVAAGLTKASVQSAFGSRDAMIEGLIARWVAAETARFETHLAGSKDPAARLQAHLACTAEEIQNTTGQKVASLLAMLASEGGHSDVIRNWYRARLGDLTAHDAISRRQRQAYLAAEGAYFLRCIIGIDADDATWHEIFADLGART
jgi:AcrR family transcriptional regulator